MFKLIIILTLFDKNLTLIRGNLITMLQCRWLLGECVVNYGHMLEAVKNERVSGLVVVNIFYFTQQIPLVIKKYLKG